MNSPIPAPGRRARGRRGAEEELEEAVGFLDREAPGRRRRCGPGPRCRPVRHDLHRGPRSCRYFAAFDSRFLDDLPDVGRIGRHRRDPPGRSRVNVVPGQRFCSDRITPGRIRWRSTGQFLDPAVLTEPGQGDDVLDESVWSRFGFDMDVLEDGSSDVVGERAGGPGQDLEPA